MPTKNTEAQPKKAAKKVAKKTVKTAKKTGTKKKPTPTPTPVQVTKVLAPEEYFWLVEGGGLNSLHALADALEQMSGEQFAYHTQRDGNDFARWIGGVFSDEELARIIARQKTQAKTAEALRKYLA